MLYFVDSLRRDPLTLLVILAALCWVAIARSRALVAAALGILLYLGYVWRIGGDFMSGRFFSTPLLVAVVTLAATSPALSRRRALAAAAAIVVLGVLPRTGLLSALNPDGGGSAIAASGIADERRYYGAAGAFLTDTPEERGGEDAQRGRQMRAAAPMIALEGAIGAIGYHAGPEVHIIDVLGLADPLLARLPAVRFDPNFALIRPEPENWRIGHFLRAVPAGYVQTIATGENHIADPGLAAVYDDLAVITRGPLASGERWRAILRMNLGAAVKERIALERYRNPRVVAYQELRYVRGAEPGAPQPALPLSYNGLHIRLPGRTTAAGRVRIALSRGNAYLIVFYRGDAITGMQPVSPSASGGAPMVPCEVRVPEATLRSGYDRIGVYPMVGDGRFAAGPIELAE
jgi:arabinofuranosyltransferase